MLGDGRKHLLVVWAGGPVIMFIVSPFTCKERVVLIKGAIKLLVCVNKWYFVRYKHVTR